VAITPGAVTLGEAHLSAAWRAALECARHCCNHQRQGTVALCLRSRGACLGGAAHFRSRQSACCIQADASLTHTHLATERLHGHHDPQHRRVAKDLGCRECQLGCLCSSRTARWAMPGRAEAVRHARAGNLSIGSDYQMRGSNCSGGHAMNPLHWC